MDDVIDLPELFTVLLAAKLTVLATLLAIALRMRRRTRRMHDQIEHLEGMIQARCFTHADAGQAGTRRPDLPAPWPKAAPGPRRRERMGWR